MLGEMSSVSHLSWTSIFCTAVDEVQLQPLLNVIQVCLCLQKLQRQSASHCGTELPEPCSDSLLFDSTFLVESHLQLIALCEPHHVTLYQVQRPCSCSRTECVLGSRTLAYPGSFRIKPGSSVPLGGNHQETFQIRDQQVWTHHLLTNAFSGQRHKAAKVWTCAEEGQRIKMVYGPAVPRQHQPSDLLTVGGQWFKFLIWWVIEWFREHRHCCYPDSCTAATSERT